MTNSLGKRREWCVLLLVAAGSAMAIGASPAPGPAAKLELVFASAPTTTCTGS